jgi:hypothetical protein
VGGAIGTYNQTPTISAPGYNSLLTGTWANKHNVWDNDIEKPNYHYWNIFRIAEKVNPEIQTAIFSTWLDNRTKLIGEGLEHAGSVLIEHDKDAYYIKKIDNAVADEAARYILHKAPDLSWIYLEYTDDMGHRFGDSPQFYEAVKLADIYISKVWESIKIREAKFDEDWLFIITTDHGRDAVEGKHHGGQSNRERTTWITTNSKSLNDRFKQDPSIVDILPSVFNHLNLPIPDHVSREIDGVPFIGTIDFSDLTATRKEDVISLAWKSFSKNKNDKVEIFVADTNHFRHGGTDDYSKIGEASIQDGKFIFPIQKKASYFKVLLKGPHHYSNVWIADKDQ